MLIDPGDIQVNKSEDAVVIIVRYKFGLGKFFKLARGPRSIFYNSADQNVHPSGCAFLLYNARFPLQSYLGVRQKVQPIFVYNDNNAKNPGG